MTSPTDLYFSKQECSEYEPILSAKNLAGDYELSDELTADNVSCDSCIYFNSFECKFYK